MTSGQFASFPIDQIWVDRAKRQRRDVSDLKDLKESILKVGLIEPPVIKADGELIAGERRWLACKELGWDTLSIQFVEDLDEDHLHLIELDENIRRVDLPWQDEVMAVKQYHELRKRLDPEWTAVKTGEAIGMTSMTVGSKIAVATAIVEGNERVKEAPLYSTARGIVEREIARKKDSIINNISFAAPKTEGQALVAEAPAKKPVPLLHADFNEWAETYSGPKFNFIHCDFPYGVGMDKSDQGAGDGHGTYEDTPDVYWELIKTLNTSSHIIADSAHLMFWFSMDYYSETMKELVKGGWRINPFPLIWMKNDGTGILPDPKRGPRRIYETAFFGSRGDRLVVRPKANAFAAPGREKSLHMNEKPVVMLKHFMEMFVDEYSLVLDPTAGSANALKAATQLGANHVLGLERDLEFFTRSIEGYYNVEL